MADQSQPPPSFTPFRRWRIGFDLALRTLLVIVVVAMINYLGSQYFTRFYLSSQTRVQLSSRTISVLQSLTNQVTVTLYYDRTAEFYPTILSLLGEYQAVNPKLVIRTVDYVRDPGEAAGERRARCRTGGDQTAGPRPSRRRSPRAPPRSCRRR